MPILPVTVTRPLGDDPPVAHLSYGAGALESLKKLPDHSVHMVATSPPYWGLRDYGMEPVHWPEVAFSPMPGLPPLIVPAGDYNLGLESTIEGYVGHLVAVFREVHRVLRGDGTFWLNLGDSYSGGGGFSPDSPSNVGSKQSTQGSRIYHGRAPAFGLKPKDLCMVPARVALALQADGWWLRSQILWVKPNPMPGSQRDRPTTDYEPVFLLAKLVRYFWDGEAVREPHKADYKFADWETRKAAGATGGCMDRGGNQQHGKGVSHDLGNLDGRTIRTTWNIPTQPYTGAHFATWPPRLVELMIKAGTSERGCCSACGAPWERGKSPPWRPTCDCNVGPCEICEGTGSFNGETTGCARCAGTGKIPAPLKRAVVLDPFSGSATTGRVAFNLNRDYIGLDANSEYLDLAVARLQGEDPPQPEDSDTESVVDLLGDA